VDARVQWPSGVSSDILLGGENVVQYKAGKLKPTTLKDEIRQPGVRDALNRDGNYVVCVGHDYNPTAAKKWRGALGKLFRNRRINPNKCRILFATDLARIANCYPSVIILPELHKDISLFLTVDRWSQQHSLKWTPDELRLETVKRIRSFLQGDGTGPVIRIQGPAGVGKTRVVLEAVREHGIAESTVYAPNSDDDHLQQLLSFLIANDRAHAVVVADECTADRQSALQSYVEACGRRVKLICIGTTDLLSPRLSASPSLIWMPVLPDDQIRLILDQIDQPVPSEIIETAVRVAKGFVKLAIFVVKQLIQQRDLNLHELSRIGDVGDFLRRIVRPEIREVLEAFSLLSRVGWKDEVAVEAQCIAEYLEIPMREMRQGVSSLRTQGVLMGQGRYFYVSPDLLAIFAAAHLWEQQGPGLIRIIEKLPGREPRFQLLRRLAAMGEHPDVKTAVEKMLEPDGLYKSIGDLDDEFRSEMLRILASALPAAVADVIDRIFAQAGHDELLGFRNGRRNVMWALESLLRWPNTSLAAAQSLRKLALAENESIGNNATAIFCQYFQIHLSGTPVPYSERLPLIDELISDKTQESQRLAVKALKSGLSHHESRMGGNVDDLSGRPYPPEWRPEKWDDLWEARRTAIARLTTLTKNPDTVGREAREALIGSVFTLIRDGIWADAIAVLKDLKPASDAERRAILDAAKRVEREVGERLSESERQKISEIQTSCFDESFSGRLRRWAGKRLHADYDLKGQTGFDAADTEVAKLAELGYKQGISEADVKWLGSIEAENAWQFGRKLGELDKSSDYLPRILESSTRDINPLFLTGYLNGQEVARGSTFRERVLDDLAKSEPILAFAVTWRGSPSQNGLHRILALVDSGALTPEMLGYLAFGGWTNAFSAQDVKQLLHRLLKGPTTKVFDPAMGIALGLLQREPDALKQIKSLIWQMIEVKPEHGWSWEWGLLADLLVEKDPKRVTSIVLSFFKDEQYLAFRDSPERKALFRAAELDPAESWSQVGAALSRMDGSSHRVLLALDESYGELIPTDVLVKWARQHLPRGPGVVAQLVAIKSQNLPERARTLLRTFRGDKYVRSVIAAQLGSGAWTGPFSGRLKYELGIAEGWAKDSDPAVRQFGRDLVKSLKRRLTEQTVKEEEGRYM